MKKVFVYFPLNFLMLIPILGSGQGIPSISTFSPSSGSAGTIVTITGANFSATAADNIVYFGAVKATTSSATENQLEVIVPVGATNQSITVTVNGLTTYSNSPFLLTFSFVGSIGGSFTTGFDYWAGYQTKWSALGDFDNDGKTDIVVADQGSNVVSVFRNTSKPGSIWWDSFEGKTDFPTGSGPYSVANGDIDGDGRMDLVVTNANEASISILRNTSTPGVISFSSQVELEVPRAPLSVAVKDLDLDGKPDIAVTNTNTLSLFRNASIIGSISSGSFDARVDHPAGNNGVWCVVLQDLDGDQKPDITVTSGGDALVSIFRNISVAGSLASGSFEPKVDFETGAYPAMLSVADLDGDHKPDLIVGNANGNTISLFRNIGAPGAISNDLFESRVDLPSAGGPWNPTAADVDGDGKPDIVVRNSSNGTLSIFKNNCFPGTISLNSFSLPYIIEMGGNPLGIAVADMDGDGLADLTVSNEGNNVISVFRNSNTFDPAGPSNLTFRDITNSTLSGDFSASPDSPDGYLVIRRIGSSPNAPVDGTTYATGQIIGDDVIAYIGSETTFDDSGLTPGVEYYYNCYAFYGTGTTVDYVTRKWAAGKAFTIGFDLGPIVSVSPEIFTLDDEITITFDATKSYPLNDLIGASQVYMYSGVISEGPESGNWNLNHAGYGYMEYAGDNKWTITFIPRYFYNYVPFDVPVYRLAMIFLDGNSHKGVSFDGRDIYLSVAPFELSPPSPLAASFVSNTGFEAEWNGVDNISDYRLDVSTTESFESFVPGFHDREVHGWGTIRCTVSGLSPNTNYFYRVRAVANTIISANSASVSVSTVAHPPMASPNVWVNHHGGPGNDEIQSMTSDSKGNIYVAGHFMGTVIVGTITLVSKGEFDIFIVKYDARGNVVWARSIGGSGWDNEVSLATDSKGLYLTANFSGEIDVDPAAGVTQFRNVGEWSINDGFFAQYNLKDGSLVWARQLIDASSWSSSSIAVERAAIYLAGHYFGTVDFDPGEGTALLTAKHQDMFLAKYSLNGDYIWASSMGGYHEDTARGLLVDGTGVYIGGNYSWSSDFDPTDGYYSLEGEGAFFGRYDLTTGALIYVKKIGNGTIHSLARYGKDLFIGGEFHGMVDANPDPGIMLIGREGYSNGIVAKYDLLDGSLRWANALTTTAFLAPRKLIADGSGVYASGYFAGSADFDPGIGEDNRTSARIDAFAARFSRTNGSLEWAKGIGGPGFSVSIAATLTHEGYYLGGLYANTVNFDPYNGDVLRTSTDGSPDIFIARYQSAPEGRFSQDRNEVSAVTSDAEPFEINLFPNPTDGILSIQWNGFDSSEPIELRIMDVFGKPEMIKSIYSEETSLNVSGLSKGHHILQARQNNRMQLLRFVKR